MRARARFRPIRKDRRAVSPAISTVILTAAMVVMLLVTMSFANNFLNQRMAESDFSAMKQFMQTTSLQIDDVAWTIGRTQTVRYASKFGIINFEDSALNYKVFLNGSPSASFNFTTGFLVFNMPVGSVNYGNGYHECILPRSDSSFFHMGTAAPVAQVFVVEKLPMNDGSYVRIVVAPIFRMFNATIGTGSTQSNYYKFYLPILSPGSNPRNSQSVTLASSAVAANTQGSVVSVRIQVEFPKQTFGYDSSFFGFDNLNKSITVPGGSIVEFYTGHVTASLGVYS